MKSERPYPKLFISKKGVRSIQNGHPWIYSDEILTDDSYLDNGCLVDAASENGKYMGTGFLSKNSRIRVRILSRNANDRFDEAFWRRRVEYAWSYRKTVMGNDISCCRIIFGEADGFPPLSWLPGDLFVQRRFHGLAVQQRQVQCFMVESRFLHALYLPESESASSAVRYDRMAFRPRNSRLLTASAPMPSSFEISEMVSSYP